MALRKIKFKKDIMLDTVIASLIVQQSPALVNKFLFKNNPLTGIELQLSSAAVVYAVGMLLKKDSVVNIGIGLVGADVVNSFLGTSGLLGDMGLEDVVSIDSYGNVVDSLDSYVDSPETMEFSNYKNNY